jgi:F420-0:gamma-glutamyl ligase-like protein
VDVIAEHPNAGRLLAEVKGHTSDAGTDIDTLFGQLLRRMADLTGATRYAVVVPESLRPTVERVPVEVRRRLGVEVWVVPENATPRREGA